MMDKGGTVGLVVVVLFKLLYLSRSETSSVRQIVGRKNARAS